MTTPKMTMAEEAIASGARPTETTVYEDGSAFFACIGFKFAGLTWMTDRHFIGCLPPDVPDPATLIPCPESFGAAMSRCPERAYVPIEDGTRVRVGPVHIAKLYFDTMIEWYGTLCTWHPALDPADGVFVRRLNRIVAVVEVLKATSAVPPLPTPEA